MSKTIKQILAELSRPVIPPEVTEPYLGAFEGMEPEDVQALADAGDLNKKILAAIRKVQGVKDAPEEDDI